MTTQKAIDRLVASSPWVFDQVVRSRQRCILTTRVAIDVLRRFGVVAEPRPCVCVVANHPYVSWKHSDRTADPPPSAWSVWAGLPVEPGDPIQPRAWAGHLVAYVPARELVVDLDFQQFARPAKLLATPPAIQATWPAEDTFARFVGRDRCGRLFAVQYERIENDGYTAAPDWRSERPVVRELVELLVRTIRKGPRAS